MKEFLVNLYNTILNFFTVDLSLSVGLSKTIAVIAIILVVLLVVKLAIGLIRWIGNFLLGF